MQRVNSQDFLTKMMSYNVSDNYSLLLNQYNIKFYFRESHFNNNLTIKSDISDTIIPLSLIISN